MKFLNLGCGTRYVKDPLWINIDISPQNPDVVKHNIIKNIPFEDNSVDLVYHSHMLEHLPKSAAEPFIHECFRVLKPGGILRIAVPDLEQIAIHYLSALNEGLQDPASAEKKANYDWMMLEMFDQTVRTSSGGEMLKFLRQNVVSNKTFILERCGSEVENLFGKPVSRASSGDQASVSLLRKIFRFVKNPDFRKDVLLKRLLKEDYELLPVVNFRKRGEIHQWMYDRFSLSHLLKKQGGQDITQQTAFTSHYPEWKKFNLDGSAEGKVHKPDSLFMEARKAGTTVS